MESELASSLQHSHCEMTVSSAPALLCGQVIQFSLRHTLDKILDPLTEIRTVIHLQTISISSLSGKLLALVVASFPHLHLSSSAYSLRWANTLSAQGSERTTGIACHHPGSPGTALITCVR